MKRQAILLPFEYVDADYALVCVVIADFLPESRHDG